MAKKRSHEEYVKLINDLHPNIEVIGQYIKANERIMVKCKNDGYEWTPKADQLFHLKYGCPVCSGRKVMAGVNDLKTIRPDLVKYLLNEEDGSKFRPQSNEYISTKCPDCGQIKTITVCELSSYGFSCQVCGDGVSYPNKFVRCFLKQLKIDYEPEKIFDWSGGKRYDQYLIDKNIIIENHGKQHYQNSTLMSPLEDQQRVDEFKQRIAEEHGIVYIVLDCSESNTDFIKKSIMKSNLPALLNFTEEDIDWEMCNYMALKSKVIETLDYLNKGISKHEILSILGISSTTLNDYIRRLTELNLYTAPKKVNNYLPKYGREKYFSILKEKSMEKLNLFLEYKRMYPTLGYLRIAEKANIDPTTIRKILKDAYSDGIIDYDITDEINENKLRKNLNLKHITKPVYVYDENYNLISKYSSVAETVKMMGPDYHAASIYATCNNKQPQYKGYYFSYIEIIKDKENQV